MSLFIGGTSSVNELHDYEEGTWTPNVFNNNTGSYTARNGWYTKIGNVVNLYFYINVGSASGGGSYFTMYGLPFTNTGNTCGSFMSKNHSMNNNRWYSLYIADSDSYLQAYGSESGANWERLTSDGDFHMIGHISYRTTS